MKEHKVVIRLLMQHAKFHQMLGRLEKAYQIFGSDEKLISELEYVLEMYRELKKESESEI